MRPLFSEEGLRRLEQATRERLLCAFDFDGTLAPIVPVPDQAQLPDAARERLHALAVHAPVAIITGRSVADVRARLGWEPDYVIGNHGMEGLPGWESLAARHEAMCRDWLAQLADALRGDGADAGIMLEDKRYSLSVHYRQAQDAAAAERRLATVFEQMTPTPRVVAGKFVFNLMPEDACHKGGALERLMSLSGACHALYAGDDVTDEDVFRLRRPNILSVRVEQRVDDSAAGFFLPRQQDMLLLLDELLARLRVLGARNWLRQ